VQQIQQCGPGHIICYSGVQPLATEELSSMTCDKCYVKFSDLSLWMITAQFNSLFSLFVPGFVHAVFHGESCDKQTCTINKEAICKSLVSVVGMNVHGQKETYIPTC